MSKIFVIGSINMDLVINTDVMPNNGETLMGHSFMSNPGGKGANQAVACAKSKADVKMVGCVGREFGEELINVLKGYKVDTKYVDRIENVSSGVAVIIINEGDNRIILDSGSNAYVTIDRIEKALKDSSNGDYYITQLETPIKDVEAGLKLAKEKGLITILNPAPAAKLNLEVFKYVDYFIPNQSEAKFYTGIEINSTDDALKAIDRLKEMGVKTPIITMGTLGSLTKVDEEIIFVKALKVKAVDTTAAGDTYVGNLATALSNGKSIKEAMEFATKASSITVQRKGAQQSIPTYDEIIK